MKQIETDIVSQLGIGQIPKYLFDKDGGLTNVYEVDWRKPTNQVFHKYNERSIRIDKGTDQTYFDGVHKKHIMDVFTYDTQNRFSLYAFWYLYTYNATGEVRHGVYQQYILNMLNVQKMPLDILPDYLSL